MQTIPTKGPEIPIAVRTEDARFEGLPDFPFPPRYVDVANPYASETPLRMHYVDEGPPDAPVVLMLHGEPAWSFLYRKLIPVFVEAGLRAVAIDQIGFGRSDKPTRPSHYSFANHIEWVRQLVERLDLTDVTLATDVTKELDSAAIYYQIEHKGSSSEIAEECHVEIQEW